MPNSPEGLQPRLNRRDFLVGLGKVGLLATIPALIADDAPPTNWQELLQRRFSFPWTKEELINYTPDRLFIVSNPTLDEESFGKHDYIYVFTHAGYTEYRISAEFKYIEEKGIDAMHPSVKDEFQSLMHVAKGIYGDYHSYVNNLENLSRILRASRAKTVFAEEADTFYSSQIPRPSLRPFDGSMIAVTRASTPVLVGQLKIIGGEVHQDINLMYAAFRRAGVKEVRLAGEWVNTRAGAACLGTMANMLIDQGFEIRGIEGCVYPQRQQFPSRDKGVKRLYDNMISLREIASAA